MPSFWMWGRKAKLKILHPNCYSKKLYEKVYEKLIAVRCNRSGINNKIREWISCLELVTSEGIFTVEHQSQYIFLDIKEWGEKRKEGLHIERAMQIIQPR